MIIISIFNGNLITKYKINQFKTFLAAFNTKYNLNIPFIPCNNKVSLTNAWLSGFTDAEGCFTCSAFLSSVSMKYIVTVRYVISQRNDPDFSKNLASLINGYVTYIKSYDGYNTVVNMSKLNIILTYFMAYPLRSKKRLSYLKWLEVYALGLFFIKKIYFFNKKKKKNKEHLKPEGIEKIKVMIKSINNKL